MDVKPVEQQDEERDPLLQEMIDLLKQNKTSFVQALQSERLLALNEQKAQEDRQTAEFYNLMAEAQ